MHPLAFEKENKTFYMHVMYINMKTIKQSHLGIGEWEGGGSRIGGRNERRKFKFPFI